jgi:hypothetical protein
VRIPWGARAPIIRSRICAWVEPVATACVDRRGVRRCGGARERNQKGMRRTIDLLEVVDDRAAAGITPILSLILGLPGEDSARSGRASISGARGVARGRQRVVASWSIRSRVCARRRVRRSRARSTAFRRTWLGAGETQPERTLIAAHADVFTTFALFTAGRGACAICARLPSSCPRS